VTATGVLIAFRPSLPLDVRCFPPYAAAVFFAHALPRRRLPPSAYLHTATRVGARAAYRGAMAVRIPYSCSPSRWREGSDATIALSFYRIAAGMPTSTPAFLVASGGRRISGVAARAGVLHDLAGKKHGCSYRLLWRGGGMVQDLQQSATAEDNCRGLWWRQSFRR